MSPLLASMSREEPATQRAMGLLIYSGWVITLLYFPSGVLHFYLGSAVYFRDVLLAVHFAASVVWLHRMGDLRWVMRQSAILLLVPVLLIPAIADPDFRFEALRTVKWTFSWLDWIFIGHFAFHYRRWDRWLGIFIGLTVTELLLEWLVGAYEWKVGHYVFATPTSWDERTVFGVQEVKDLRLGADIRVRGLQRDVFSFANLMAMSAVLGLAWASISRQRWQRAVGFAWAAFFAVMLVISGGRSALFGILASTILSIGFAVDHHRTRRWSNGYVLGWVAVAMLISLVGVGKLTETVSGTFLGKARIGDSSSAYMRDDNWTNIQAAFEQEPIILVIGGPIASLLDTRIAPMFHWADNQFLWDTYHLGLAGAVAIAFYFFRVLWISRPGVQARGTDVIVLCLLFVIGEGIARESLTFMGCMPLFIACGYVSAATAAAVAEAAESATRPRSRRRRRTRAIQSA